MGQKILSQLEQLAYRLQLRYMFKKRTIELVDRGRACFFPLNCRDKILLEYQERLVQLKVK